MFYTELELQIISEVGGPAAKFENNLAALRLMKRLQAENRPATLEEQRILMRYVGWGDLSVLRRGLDANNRPTGELASLLSEAEIRRLLGSALNAHYTALPIVRAIWSGVRRLFGGAPRRALRVLEPAAGIGHFIAAMPEPFHGADVTAVELDLATAGILRLLHPDARVFAMGLEDAPLPERAFDIAISNIPFGNYRVFDSAIRERFIKKSIHSYFFAKSLSLLRPGGLLAFITSRYTMDALDERVRAWLAERADLLAAVRLPDSAFVANAGASVVTDVLFLRRRVPGEDSPCGALPESWLETKQIMLRGQYSDKVPVNINGFYAGHPEFVIGSQSNSGRGAMGHPTYTVSLAEGIDEIARRLQSALEAQLPEGLLSSDSEQGASWQISFKAARPERTFACAGGEDFGFNAGIPDGASTADKRVIGLRSVYVAAKSLIQAELRGLPDDAVESARQSLNQAYKDFTSLFGPIHERRNIKAIKNHPALPFLLALENRGPEGYAPADIFHRRTVRAEHFHARPQTAHEALALSLNRFGKVEMAWMSEMLGAPVAQVAASLKGSVFLDPETGDYVTDDEYLSGNVRAKLKAARAAALFDSIFNGNVEALELVQPPPIRPRDISARPGAGWIPVEIVRDFIRAIIPNVRFSLEYIEDLASWSLEFNRLQASESIAATEVWGTKRADAFTLIADALNSQHTVVYDEDRDGSRTRNEQETVAAQAKQAAIRARFEEWVWSDPERAETLAGIYNDRFNIFRARRYNGQHMTLPGLRSDFEPWPHQKDAVWRIIQSRTTLLAHDVGFGKTAIIAMAAAELLRLGLARKCLIVAPNHLVGQWHEEITRLYPALNVLCAGEKDMSAAKRGEFLSRIATGDHQVIVLAHSQFRLLPVSQQTLQAHLLKDMDALEEVIRELKAENGSSRSLKDVERARKRIEAQLREIQDMKRDDARAAAFEELGIDFMAVDEAHLFKNLWFHTKRTRVAGLPNSHSQRAYDMLLKTHWLLEHGGRVVFATATPVANTMAEAYTMMRFLQPDLLRDMGIAHFDAWAQMYGEDVTGVEVTPDGSGFRINTRFARWVNLPELSMIWRQTMDVRRSDTVQMNAPSLYSGRPVAVLLPISRRLREFIRTLVERAERIRAGKVRPEEDNMLSVTADGRMASIDMRLLAPGPEDRFCKINALTDNLFAIWQASQPRRGTQLVFCDIGTPRTKAESDDGNEDEPPELDNQVERALNNRVYHEIRNKLIRLGVPPSEIAFIHDARTRAERQELFSAMNSGAVRILIGSTEKMGTGMNAQKRLIALHHLDAPWRPDQVQQREGRILRPGNEYQEVFVFTYQIEGSFDAYIWQTLHSKIEYISQIMAGEVTSRTAEDVSDVVLTYADLKALASGNPNVRRRVMIESELSRLGRLRWAWEDSTDRLKDDLRRLPERIARAKGAVALFERAIAARDAAAKQPFSLTLRTHSESGLFASREEAGKKLMLLGERAAVLLKKSGQSSLFQKIGSYAGFDLAIRLSSFNIDDRCLILMLGDDVVAQEARITNTAAGTISSLDHQLRALERRLAESQDALARLERQMDEARAQISRDWEYQAKYDALRDELRSITREIEHGAATPGQSPNMAVPAVHEQDHDEIGAPGAAVLASMAAVRQAIERIHEIHHEPAPAVAPTAHDAFAPQAASYDSIGSDAVGSDAVGSDAVGSDAVGSDAVGSDADCIKQLESAVDALKTEVEDKSAHLVFGQMVLSQMKRKRRVPSGSENNGAKIQLSFDW